MAPPPKNRSRSISSSGSDRDRHRDRKRLKDSPAAKEPSKVVEKSRPKAIAKRAQNSRSPSSGSSRSGSTDSSSSSGSDSGSDSSTSSSGTESGSERSGSVSPKSKTSRKASPSAEVTKKSSKEKNDRRSKSASRDRAPQKRRSATPEKGRFARDVDATVGGDGIPVAVTKLFISRLTHNVTKDHVAEIFGKFGKVKEVEMPMEPEHPTINRNIAHVEFENPEDALKAHKYMNGGQIDGQTIVVSTKRDRLPDQGRDRDRERVGGRKFSGPRFGGGGRGGNGGGGGGFGYGGRGGGGRRGSPPAVGGRRSRSRSPISRHAPRRSRSNSPRARR